MTTIEISKKKIIQALKTEPLAAGVWVAGPLNKKLDDKNCTVCAVGAVIRNCLDKSQYLSKISSAANEATGLYEVRNLVYAKYMIVIKKYMNALSCFFEGQWTEADRRSKWKGPSRHQIYRIRQKTIKFVEENFPNKVQINIGDARPAKDVKVIYESRRN